jgi:ParB family chromosome partitioning protein
VTEKPRRLGRGLEALLGASTAAPSAPADQSRELPLDLIRPNPYQPRRDFTPDELAELEASMRTSGLLQPVTVRAAGDGYELVAGERRVRAARNIGWQSIPAIVRQFDQRQMLTLALVENLQRADLNPIEEADGYFRLQSEFGLTQQQIADAVGKDRSTVANLLRLRMLPESVRVMLRDGRLSAGHARALLALPNEESVATVAQRVVDEQLTVRDVERMGRGEQPPGRTQGRAPASSEKPTAAPIANGASAELRRIEERLRRYLQTDVTLTADGNAHGEIRIRFYSAEDLDRVLTLIIGASEDRL